VSQAVIGNVPSEATTTHWRQHGNIEFCLSRPERYEISSEVGCVRNTQYSRRDNRFAPGEQERPWPPISSTLIYGSRDAVVVDSFITLQQARAQADWIGSTGKNLTTIYATHGHGDHFFGASVLLERFPNARFVAASSAIQVMKEQTSPEFVAKFWESRFPNQLPKRLVVAHELSTNVIELEGERLMVMPLGFTGYRRNDVLARAIAGTDRRRGCRLQRRASETHGS